MRNWRMTMEFGVKRFIIDVLSFLWLRLKEKHTQIMPSGKDQKVSGHRDFKLILVAVGRACRFPQGHNTSGTSDWRMEERNKLGCPWRRLISDSTVRRNFAIVGGA